jgi:hypothetical protein
MKKLISVFLFDTNIAESIFIKRFCAITLLVFIFIMSGCKSDSEISEEQDKTLKSLTKLNNYPFYTMNYVADYGLKKFIDTGYKPEFSQYEKSLTGCFCTCFSASGSNSEFIYGRNYDWHNHAGLLLFTHPADGYASVSMVDIGVYGYSETNTADNYNDRRKLLDAPYSCVEGMNECGVVIAEMSVPNAEPPFSTSKKTITADVLIRIVLDYARDAEDALRLIQTYNLNFDIGEKVHYLIADSSGYSMIIEFVDNEVKTIRNTNPWQVCTNFVISGATLPPMIDSGYNDQDSFDKWRYVKASLMLRQNNGNITVPKALNLLKTVSANFGPPYNTSTMWSAAYNLKTREVSVIIDRNIANVYKYGVFDF